MYEVAKQAMLFSQRDKKYSKDEGSPHPPLPPAKRVRKRKYTQPRDRDTERNKERGRARGREIEEAWLQRSYKGRQTTTDLRVLTRLFVIKDSIVQAQYHLTQRNRIEKKKAPPLIQRFQVYIQITVHFIPCIFQAVLGRQTIGSMQNSQQGCLVCGARCLSTTLTSLALCLTWHLVQCYLIPRGVE